MTTMNKIKCRISFFIGVLLSVSFSNLQAQEVITGSVIDAEGEPLIGVNIIVKDVENQGTVSDIDGSFTLDIPPGASTLVFSYIGYLSQEIAIADRVDWNIILQNDVQTLNEVVVVGYGVQRKSDLTGSTSLCFDEATGVLTRSEVAFAGGVMETKTATSIRPSATAADFDAILAL